jgi:hypothetical protein
MEGDDSNKEDSLDEGDGDGDGGDGDGDDANQQKAEYVKKVIVARPYVSEFNTYDEVDSKIVRNSRPMIRMRISRPRKEFGVDGTNFIERDANDQCPELKSQSQSKNNNFINKKKCLDIGLQAAYEMKTFSSQTYFNRTVNACTMYDPKDFINKLASMTT